MNLDVAEMRCKPESNTPCPLCGRIVFDGGHGIDENRDCVHPGQRDCLLTREVRAARAARAPAPRDAEIARLRDQVAAWKDTAAHMARNVDFWHGIVAATAKHLGDAVRRQDDGGMVPEGDFLALAVPDAVGALREALAAAEAHRNSLTVALRMYLDGCTCCEGMPSQYAAVAALRDHGSNGSGR